MPLVRACARPGCAGYASLDARYCPDHSDVEAAARRARDLARATRPNRTFAKRVYDDPRWDRCRAVALERDGDCCVMCSSTRGLNVHHILGITGTDDDFDPELVVTLCSTCHPIAERRRRQGYASR